MGFDDLENDSHTALIISSESDEQSGPSNSLKRSLEDNNDDSSDSDSFATERVFQKRTKQRLEKIIEEPKTVSNSVIHHLIEERLKNKPNDVKSFIKAQFEENKTEWHLDERQIFQTMYQKSPEYYCFLMGMKFVMPPIKMVKKWISESQNHKIKN